MYSEFLMASYLLTLKCRRYKGVMTELHVCKVIKDVYDAAVWEPFPACVPYFDFGITGKFN